MPIGGFGAGSGKENTDHAFSYYPNPAKDYIHFTLPGDDMNSNQGVLFELFDVMGAKKESQKLKITGNEFRVDLKNHSTGLYSLKLVIGEKVYTEKIYIK